MSGFSEEHFRQVSHLYVLVAFRHFKATGEFPPRTEPYIEEMVREMADVPPNKARCPETLTLKALTAWRLDLSYGRPRPWL